MKDLNNDCDLLIIENSYFDQSIDTVKIFNKNFSTKPKNSGIGLWRVRKIINKHSNLILNKHFYLHFDIIFYHLKSQ